MKIPELHRTDLPAKAWKGLMKKARKLEAEWRATPHDPRFIRLGPSMYHYRRGCRSKSLYKKIERVVEACS